MKDRGIFGYEQLEDNTTMVVMDSENDLMAIYNVDENDQKSAQAIPSMMSMAAAFGSIAAADLKDEMGEFTLEKTGKTKNLLDINV